MWDPFVLDGFVLDHRIAAPYCTGDLWTWHCRCPDEMPRSRCAPQRAKVRWWLIHDESNLSKMDGLRVFEGTPPPKGFEIMET